MPRSKASNKKTPAKGGASGGGQSHEDKLNILAIRKMGETCTSFRIYRGPQEHTRYMFPYWPSNAHHLSHLEGHAAKRAAKRRLPRVRVLVVGVSRKAEVERLRWTSLTCAAHVVRWGFCASMWLFYVLSFLCVVVFAGFFHLCSCFFSVLFSSVWLFFAVYLHLCGCFLLCCSICLVLSTIFHMWWVVCRFCFVFSLAMCHHQAGVLFF